MGNNCFDSTTMRLAIDAAHGNASELSRRLQIPRTTLMSWVANAKIPNLANIIKLFTYLTLARVGSLFNQNGERQ